jgi:hypothetical protein
MIVAGDEPGVGGSQLHGLVKRLQGAFQRAAVIDIDKGIAVVAVEWPIMMKSGFSNRIIVSPPV